MKKPVLVVMAAGMGSRYGGMKQIDPVGSHGQVIVDYDIFDAKRTGFETVVFIIKHEIEEEFKKAIGDRLASKMEVRYAYQRLENLPQGYSVPQDRVKPWGTAHAILSAKDVIDGPFAVINADDYYGPEAFREVYAYLEENGGKPGRYCMVGYKLANTVTEHGYVARGVCSEDDRGFLLSITERTHIEKTSDGIKYTEDGGETWTPLADGTPVSMNLWGFGRDFIDAAESGFAAFLDEKLKTDPLKCEYFLPSVVSRMMDEGSVEVKVLKSGDKWYGVTYKEDKPVVMKAIAEKTAGGLYPQELWG